MTAPDWLLADPMARELLRCGVNPAQVDDLIERAAIMEAEAGVPRAQAELLIVGEAYSS